MNPMVVPNQDTVETDDCELPKLSESARYEADEGRIEETCHKHR